ncbi:MAG: polyphosphate kinase 1 [Acidimicrobiaceae bacterium]
MGNNLFVNRELSWLDFNRRVLAFAQDSSVPLLERFKFIAIFSSNLDEFFQVRVGALHDRVEAGITQLSFDGMTPTQQLLSIRARTLSLVSQRDEILNSLIEEFRNEGYSLLTVDQLSFNEQQTLDQYFSEDILPVLTPLAVDPTHPFPYISNLALSIGVLVTDPETDTTRFARVKVPDTIPRFIDLGDNRFIPLEAVITDKLSLLFPGMKTGSPSVFRVTRNTDLSIDSEEAEDLLEMVELELRRRRFGNAVRLEVSKSMTDDVLSMILEELELDPEDVYRHEWFVGGTELWQLHRIKDAKLHDAAWSLTTAGRLSAASDAGQSFFSVLRHRDLMVHHPYESFSTSVEEFIRQASVDPSVLAIKLTLYRTSSDTSIIKSLVRAAERGKQVAALVELKARFDEKKNIGWAKELEKAGVHVIYGLMGLKIHTKTTLVVREEHDGIRRYCHIGTGNYNPKTARLYEDVGLLTADPAVGSDLTQLFNLLTGFARDPEFSKLLISPTTIRPGIADLIANEAALGAEGHIVLKMNSLVDAALIDSLYAASQAGTRVDLIVRGICCLRPGVPGLSENIHVRSIVGRYLEHSRIYYFKHGAAGAPVYYIGSADLMPRNLDRRVEALVPVEDPLLQARLHEILDVNLEDDSLAWALGPDTTWSRVLGTDQFDTHRRFEAIALERRF